LYKPLFNLYHLLPSEVDKQDFEKLFSLMPTDEKTKEEINAENEPIMGLF
jgi:hypothetical protein